MSDQELKVSRGNSFKIPIDFIIANDDDNCRISANDAEGQEKFREGIKELAKQIREEGQLVPIIVTKLNDKEYKLIAGSRRVAAQRLNQEQVGEPLTMEAIVKNKLNDIDILSINLCENVQRQDLTCIEEARAIKKLANAGLRQSGIADRIGKSPMWVSQRMALGSLNYDIQMKIHNGEITMVQGLAFAKLSSDDQTGISQKIEEAKAEAVPTIPVVVNPFDELGDESGSEEVVVKSVDNPVLVMPEITPAEQQKVITKAAKAAARAMAQSIRTPRKQADPPPAPVGRPDLSEVIEVLNRGMQSPKIDDDTKLILKNIVRYLDGTIRDEDEFLANINEAVLAIKPEEKPVKKQKGAAA